MDQRLGPETEQQRQRSRQRQRDIGNRDQAEIQTRESREERDRNRETQAEMGTERHRDRNTGGHNGRVQPLVSGQREVLVRVDAKNPGPRAPSRGRPVPRGMVTLVEEQLVLDAFLPR